MKGVRFAAQQNTKHHRGKARRSGISWPIWPCISRPNNAMDGKKDLFAKVQRSST